MKAKTIGGGPGIFDTLRLKWIVLTPEEWVRQHLIRTLIEHLKVSPKLIAQEHPVSIQGMCQRADIVVFGSDGKPLLLAECKAADVGIDEKAYAQAVRYNAVLGARYILLTDGMRHLIFESDGTGNYQKLTSWPPLH